MKNLNNLYQQISEDFSIPEIFETPQQVYDFCNVLRQMETENEKELAILLYGKDITVKMYQSLDNWQGAKKRQKAKELLDNQLQIAQNLDKIYGDIYDQECAKMIKEYKIYKQVKLDPKCTKCQEKTKECICNELSTFSTIAQPSDW